MIFRDGRVLLVRRARSPGKGFYSLPGGRVEFGETLHTALHREIDEETGLRVDILGLAGWREVLPTGPGTGHYMIMTFAARWASREPVLNDEHDDFRWLVPEAIGDLKVTGGLHEVIAAAQRLV
ncbi:MAG: methylglutaconyl-CoA hydratase [Bradyrhizobium sp. DFCI-1]|nr:MAG: methylglutaconyl-CoA hydratase [Bradyrhizobium sp. DFCI-1]